MKKSNYIAEKVFKTNLKISRLQNKTKELFFRCLDEGQELEYFKAKLEELWGNVDYSYMQEELAEYEAIIHEKNLYGKKVEEIPKGDYGVFFALTPLSVLLTVNDKFKRIKTIEYKRSLESYGYKTDKQEYLKLKVPKYNNQIVPYYSKKTGKFIRAVQPSTYDSMIHNTNLTRTGWNTTLNDANRLGANYFIIPYHPFSCEYCMEHQNRLMSKQEVIDMIGFAEETEGDILHPNCKCELTIVDDVYDMYEEPYSYLTEEEKIEISHIRQKVNSLTLKKEELLTDLRIEKILGNQDEIDKLNQKRSKINKSIRELKEALPTEELRKQVVAINR